MAASTSLVFAGKSVAAPAISFLITKAFSYLNEYCKSEGMDEVKNRLLMAMPKIQAVFDVVNPERVREQSSALDAWLWQLRDAVEEAEDAVDELEYYELEEKAKDRNVTDWGSSFAKMKHKSLRSVKHTSILDKTLKKLNHRDTLKKLKKAVDGLDKAAAGVTGFLTLTDHLNGVASSSQQQVQLVNHDRQTGSTLSATRFIGREKEKEQIIGWLMKTSVESAEIVTSTSSIPIISVVGHGGMGKTTLVQSICAEDVVLKHFKVIWVTISTSFDATSVTSKILECATGAKPSATLLEPLQQDLKEKLKSVNFLLVLDDVWEDNKRDEWEKLFAPLRKVNTGSIILLTTRMHSVVDMAASVMEVERDQCLTLEGLEEDENIELFNHHVFSGLNSPDNVQLKLIGEEIAKKLGGCPLVTKIVGGHLQGNLTPGYWSRFLREGLKHYKGAEEDIMKVLRLSYYHLPTDLQICFRYCCIFPQDYEYGKKELVQMWMGSGLISQPGCDLQTLEDNGEQLLARLTRKSFFDLKYRVYSYRKEEYYVMHDLIHDLARSVSLGECARISDPARFEAERRTVSVRHLCIASIQSFSVDEIKKISHFKNLRTLIIADSVEVDRDLVCAFEKIVESSKSLRLFHSKLENTSHIAYKFGNLKHLRYIHVHQISPDGICGVVKLYHLMLLHCLEGLQKQTKQVRYLGNLERLRYVSYGVHMLGEFPISRLTSLQELDNYRVKESIGNKVSAIRSLRDLRELKLQCIENVVNHEEAKNAKLEEKQHLSLLSLNWSACTGAENRRDDLVLDHLKPHCNIRELHISNYEGLKLPIWIENMSVKNLVSLKLKSCINWEHLPSLRELVLLKHLKLDNLPKLKQIGQSSHMSSSSSMVVLLPPSLDSLLVSRCQELCGLPILPPSLVTLEIDNVGLTKLPKIGKIFSENAENKPPQLERISVNNCSCLISLEGSLLEQEMYVGALRHLEIKNCIHLESASIPFEEMSRLVDLKISNCPNMRTIRDAKDKLLPSSLWSLNMGQCGDLELPLLGSLQRFTNLSSMGLWKCSRLISLPSAEVFNTSLKSLTDIVLWQCENLSSLGGLGSLPSLYFLEISRCSKLVEAGLSQTADVSPTRGEEEHLVEPGSSLQIRTLQIDHPSLQILELEIDLPSLLLVEPLKSLCHIQQLVILDGSEMESFPEGWLLQNRSSLWSLGIWNAKSLPPSMRDSSLESLWVYRAEQLRSLPDLPSSLKSLTVLGAEQLQSLPDLPSSLQDLEVGGAAQLQSLPDLPSSLEYLTVGDAAQLRSLPDLPSSLEYLTVGDAEQLQSLPDLPFSLKDLFVDGAEQLQSLPDLPSSLQTLCLPGCNSELEKKRRQYFHIPRVRLGESYFIMGKECSEETFERLSDSDHGTLTSWANHQKDDKRVGSSLTWWKKQ